MATEMVCNCCFLVRGDDILLAMKKRGFGIGKWNGAGGKLQNGESIEKSAVREIFEELRVTVFERNLEKVAVLNFEFKNGLRVQAHYYIVRKWMGEPTETDEMAPRWFKQTEIPFDQMWCDDHYWLPRILAGEKLEGKFAFSADTTQVERWSLRPASW
jgi:ADP-ribose pyrophosphatase YjhB (NUDIX family)